MSLKCLTIKLLSEAYSDGIRVILLTESLLYTLSAIGWPDFILCLNY